MISVHKACSECRAGSGCEPLENWKSHKLEGFHLNYELNQSFARFLLWKINKIPGNEFDQVPENRLKLKLVPEPKQEFLNTGFCGPEAIMSEAWGPSAGLFLAGQGFEIALRIVLLCFCIFPIKESQRNSSQSGKQPHKGIVL